MTDIQRTKYFFNRCNPEEPISSDDPDNFYVDFDSYGLRGEKCIDVMAEIIQLSSNPTTQIFTGFPGAGKTSELFRLSKRLSDLNYLVVYSDSLRTIDVLNPIEYADVLVTLGLAVDEHLASYRQDDLVIRWVRNFGNELKDLLFADVALKDFKFKAGTDIIGSEIGVELKKNPGFRTAIRQAANDRRRQFLDQVQDFFRDATDFAYKNGFTGGLVVILDNLEKLSSDIDTRDSVRNMFLHNADALKQPGVHLIYTVPAPLVFSDSGPQLGRIYDGEPLVLPMVKLQDRQSRIPIQEGVDALLEMLNRRVDLEEVFANDENVTKLLVQTCGGYARDLLRLLQYSLQAAWGLPVRYEHVDVAIRKLEKSYRRGFNTNDLPLLNYVKNERPENIPDQLKSRLEQVMLNHYVMIYGNDTEWYDVHPIVDRFISQNP